MVDIYAALISNGDSKEEAWRHSFYVPGAMLIITAVIVYAFGVDTPQVRPLGT